MSKVIWHVTMSLDGFIAGPDDEMDWAFEHTAPSALRSGIYGGAWSGPVFVLTHRPPEASNDPSLTFLSDGVRNAVATASTAAGEKSVGIFGADIARQCLRGGLLDEIVVHLAPVLLGNGVRFHDTPGAPRVQLERTAVGESGQLTDLRFTVL